MRYGLRPKTIARPVPAGKTGGTRKSRSPTRFPPAKIRNIIAVPALSIVTIGIYIIFWWYFVRRELKDYGRTRGTEELGTRAGKSVLAITRSGHHHRPGRHLVALRAFKRVQAAQRLS